MLSKRVGNVGAAIRGMVRPQRHGARVVCEACAMNIARSPVTAALAGAASWTAAEYGLHRFAMHEMRGKGLASVEHLKHHADVTYFSPASKKAGVGRGHHRGGLPAGHAAWPAGDGPRPSPPG